MTKHPSDKGFFKFIAYLQIIGIILVVLGHSFHEYPDGDSGKSLLLYRMMYSFRMPLFIFVSGFLMMFTTIMREQHQSWGAFVKVKVKRLLVPFIVLTIVTFVPRSLMSAIADDYLPLSAGELMNSLLYQDRLVIPYFWFLQASFTLLVVTFGIILITRRFRKDQLWMFLLLIIVYRPHNQMDTKLNITVTNPLYVN